MLYCHIDAFSLPNISKASIDQDQIQEFIWNGKKPKIKYETLIGEYEEGGLKMTDFSSFLESLRAKRFLNMILYPDALMNLIPTYYLKNIGGCTHVKDNFDQRRIPKNLPFFYKESLLSWVKLYESKQKAV